MSDMLGVSGSSFCFSFQEIGFYTDRLFNLFYFHTREEGLKYCAVIKNNHGFYPNSHYLFLNKEYDVGEGPERIFKTRNTKESLAVHNRLLIIF
jgi:hypothetical protein